MPRDFTHRKITLGYQKWVGKIYQTYHYNKIKWTPLKCAHIRIWSSRSLRVVDSFDQNQHDSCPGPDTSVDIASQRARKWASAWLWACWVYVNREEKRTSEKKKMSFRCSLRAVCPLTTRDSLSHHENRTNKYRHIILESPIQEKPR
jgi:hypothetical protein